MTHYHTSVLPDEAIGLLAPSDGGVYVDLTFGGGGHARRILSLLGPEGRLYAFDTDADAALNLPSDKRLRFLRSNFRYMRAMLRREGVAEVDGVLADLGVSSHHFDTPERGFSFRSDGPLDMRMNAGARLDAARVVNEYSEEALRRILRDWGEVEHAGRVARRLAEARTEAPILTTGALVGALGPVTPPAESAKFLSRIFQALRIEVNGEMESLQMALEQSGKLLRPGGRIVVLSYHSLEDRLVKNFLRSGNFEGRIEKDFYGRPCTPWRLLTRRPVMPDPEEVARNPRARSARLRAAEKCPI